MLPSDLLRLRLYNQHLSHSTFKKPQQVVAHLAAMQAQEYAMAKWAIGLRMAGSSDADVEKAFNKGSILRTHLLRPTWHFVAPADIRWLTKLTAPRVNQASAFMFRQMELTDAIFKKTNTIFERALQGNHLTRIELKAALDKAKIVSTEFRMAYMLMRAELDGIICSGPRKGKQFTYALLEERVAPVKPLTRDEALAELSKRYFISRGPASLKDFTTWSGLTVKDANAGLAMIMNMLEKETINGENYFFKYNSACEKVTSNISFLMPDYDEYGMGYKDRSAIFNADKYKKHVSRGNPVFNRMIIIDGKIAGTWQRAVSKKEIVINSVPFAELSKTDKKSLERAETSFRKFLGGSIGN